MEPRKTEKNSALKLQQSLYDAQKVKEWPKCCSLLILHRPPHIRAPTTALLFQNVPTKTIPTPSPCYSQVFSTWRNNLKIYWKLMSKEGWSQMSSKLSLASICQALSRKWHYSFTGEKEYFSLHTGVEIKAITVSPNMFFFNSNVIPAKTIVDNFNTQESKISSSLYSLCSAVGSPSFSLSKVMPAQWLVKPK